ncbi:MAG: phosphoribosylanthranilate isomerase [Ignavibacteriales bacterium]|nr:phosphoribosylanthranilate isomerase [Ignavibacteriales bacterium]
MKVKICGITNIEDALLCAEYNADAVGFIFYEKSKRHITFEKAEEIIKQLPPFLMKVGVFVNEEVDIVNESAQKIGLNTVQLHGDEFPEYVSKIHLPVIKAFRVDEKFDWTIIDDYKNCGIMLDSYLQNEYGGTGKIFKWNTIPTMYKNKIILSGGITIDKLDQIFSEIKPAAIDVSSSLEISPCKKDPQKLKEFLIKFNKINYRE